MPRTRIRAREAHITTEMLLLTVNNCGLFFLLLVENVVADVAYVKPLAFLLFPHKASAAHLRVVSLQRLQHLHGQS